MHKHKYDGRVYSAKALRTVIRQCISDPLKRKRVNYPRLDPDPFGPAEKHEGGSSQMLICPSRESCVNQDGTARGSKSSRSWARKST